MATLLKEYLKFIETNQFHLDPAQKELVLHLQQVIDEVQHHPRTIKALYQAIFRKNTEKQSKRDTNGLYIHGNVGQGKSMLMALFYTHLRVKKKALIHFQAFMQMVHTQFHAWQELDTRADHQDSAEWLAEKLAKQYTVLCLDELYITEIGDAMIISRLLSLLMEKGVFLVITSNRAPNELYLDGVAKFNFVQFIALLESHTSIYNLSTNRDYRMSKTPDAKQHYFYPLGEAANAFIAQWRGTLLGNHQTAPVTLSLQGREIQFAASYEGILFTSFEELCVRTLGPADYLLVAKTFHTIVLTDIPPMSEKQRNQAKRFTMLIDQLYEQKVKLICTAAVPEADLYVSGDESFEFARTVSRLAQMQGKEWLDN